jgi:hypothetical protein
MPTNEECQTGAQSGGITCDTKSNADSNQAESRPGILVPRYIIHAAVNAAEQAAHEAAHYLREAEQERDNALRNAASCQEKSASRWTQRENHVRHLQNLLAARGV